MPVFIQREPFHVPAQTLEGLLPFSVPWRAVVRASIYGGLAWGNFLRLIFACLFLIVSIDRVAAAGTSSTGMVLAWDPSPSPGVSGYRIYRGTSSGFYITVTDVGNATSIAMTDLLPGTSYYFVMTAYDASGQESGFSNEATYTPATVEDPETPTVGLPTMKLSLSLQGGMKLSATGPAGRTYDLLASQDMKNWVVIGIVSLGGDGRLEFVDPEAFKFPARFYRARETQPSVQLRMVPPSHTEAGGAMVSVTGQNGRTYDVLASPNLVDWKVVGAATVGESGRVDFMDTDAVNYPARFYRTQERPL